MRFLIAGAGAVGGFVGARLADAGQDVTVLVSPAVIGGTLRVATELEDDGTIRALAPTFEVEVGELDGTPSARISELAAAFRTAGAQVAVRDDIIGAMWAKWVFIASIGAVTSLMRATAGEIVAVPGGDRFARSVISEAAATTAAAGHPAPGDVLRETEQALTTPGSPATSSLSRDLSMNRPAEVEAVLADLASRARATGTATPLLDVAVLALRIHNRRLSHRQP